MTNVDIKIAKTESVTSILKKLNGSDFNIMFAILRSLSKQEIADLETLLLKVETTFIASNRKTTQEARHVN